jgi:hypothetical protein
MKRDVLPYRQLFGLSWILIFVGCDSTFEPPKHTPPDDLAVNAVLVLGQYRQRILLTNVVHVDTFRYDFISNADVFIDSFSFFEWPEDSIRFRGNVQQWSEFYNYYLDGLPLDAGREYRLDIKTEDRSIQGMTRMPLDFDISNTGRRIFWTPAKAALYIVKIDDDEFITQDTSFTYQPDGDFIPGRHTVTVSACDDNYAWFALQLTQQSGISGAYGVFGSIVEKSVTMDLP